jgi:hypothetical protein
MAMLLPHVRGRLTYIYSTVCKEESVQCMVYTLYNEQCIMHNSSNLRAQSSTVLDPEEKKRNSEYVWYDALSIPTPNVKMKILPNPLNVGQ